MSGRRSGPAKEQPPRCFLVVDDNPDDRALVERHLRRRFPALEVVEAADPEGLDAALSNGSFDAVVTDYHLHWSDGLTVLRRVRERFPDLPVVMFTGTGTQEIAVEAMKAGLDDYVIKSPKHFIRLASAVGRVLERAADRKAAAEAQDRYRSLFEGVPVGLYRSTPDGRFLDANAAMVEILGYPDRKSLLATPTVALWADPAQRRELRRLIDPEGVLQGIETRLLRHDGSPVWVRMSARVVRRPDGAVDHYQGVVQDISASKRSASRIQDLNRQLEQRVARLAALRQIDLAITGSVDLRITLQVLLSQVRSQLRVDAVAVLLFRRGSQLLTFAAGDGFHTDAIQGSSLRLGEGFAGRAALDRETVVVPHLAEASEPYVRSWVKELEGAVGYCAVPLVSKGGLKGVLECYQRRRLEVSPDWLEFLEALSTQAALAVDNAQLFEELERSNSELTVAYDATIEGWSRALDLRDQETEGHSRRVTVMTIRLARALGMGEAEIAHVRRGALLHDVGKLGIPDAILHKEGPLDEAEWEIMREHPVHAYRWLSPIRFLRPALDIPYAHHERWDGSGYPRGLRGEEIPLAARIFAIVDVWDALTHVRPYRRAWAPEEALSHLRQQGDRLFDPRVLAAFEDLAGEPGFLAGEPEAEG